MIISGICWQMREVLSDVETEPVLTPMVGKTFLAAQTISPKNPGLISGVGLPRRDSEMPSIRFG